jgi:hypothetical protein
LPFVQVACLCEHVLVENDNVASAIRIVDTFNISTVELAAIQLGAGVPINMDAAKKAAYQLIPVRAWLLLSLKASTAQAEPYNGEIRSYNTEGELKSTAEFEFRLDSEEAGATVVLNVTLLAEKEGRHHLDIVVDGQLLTRIPYRINLVEDQAEPPETGKAVDES